MLLDMLQKLLDRIRAGFTPRTAQNFQLSRHRACRLSEIPEVIEQELAVETNLPECIRYLATDQEFLSAIQNNSSKFCFIRGLIAIQGNDFDRARQEFVRYCKEYPDRISATVAGLMVRRIDLLSESGPEFSLLIKNELDITSNVSQSKRILVVSDYPVGSISKHLDFLADATPATIIAANSSVFPPPDSINRAYVYPSVFVWHTENGRRQHDETEEIAGRIANFLCLEIDLLKDLNSALKFHILDMYVYKWILIDNLRKSIQKSDFDNVIVVTADEKFFFLICGLIKLWNDNYIVFPKWISKPSILRNPLLDLWPKNFSQKAISAPRDFDGNRNDFRSEFVKNLFDFSSIDKSSNPVIVGWNARDQNYIKSLVRLLNEILKLRPVILFLDSDDDDKVSHIRQSTSELCLRTGNYLHVVRYSEIYLVAKHETEQLGSAIGEALRSFDFGCEPTGFNREFAERLCRHDLAANVAENLHLRATVLCGHAIDQLMTRCQPAYGVMASARGSAFAAIAEKLATRSIPSMDAHVYLVGNHARQIAPPCLFAGVIDDQQEALIREIWGFARENILRIGYLWREHSSINPAVIDAYGENPARILICSQPGDPEMVEHFMADVLDCIVSIEGVEGVIKPHPAETEPTIEAYREAIRVRGLEDRVHVEPGTNPLPDYFDSSNLVITRTSNAGIEAALQMKPTIRYIEYDRYDPGVTSDVVYAVTVGSKQDLAPTVRALLFDEAAQTRLREDQQRYMDENPAQAAIDGAERIVRFLESKVAGG